MNDYTFSDRMDCLAKLSDLPRQSVCFQIMLTMQLCHKGLDERLVERLEHEGKTYYSYNSLQVHMNNVKIANNAKSSLGALTEHGFLEKLVISQSGEVMTGSSYFRGGVTVYYRLSEVGLALFGLES